MPTTYVDPFGLDVLNPNNYPVSPDVMRALENFNDYVGRRHDIVITGGDRSCSSQLGSGCNSQHVQKTAADIKIPGITHLETANAALQCGLFSGVGWYEEGFLGPNGEGPHVHVDLRAGRTPTNPATWGYAKGSKRAGKIPPYSGKPNLGRVPPRPPSNIPHSPPNQPPPP